MPRTDEYLARQTRREISARLDDEWEKILHEVQFHPESHSLSREAFQKTFEYVEKLYPKTAPCIAAAKVYKNTNTAFCRKIGIPKAAGGAFLIRASAILICYSRNHTPDDVILVHELLHFASQLMGSDFISEAAEEDFAYRKSIPYLKANDYDDDWIRKTFLMPYYLGKAFSETTWAGQNYQVEEDAIRRRVESECQLMIDEEMLPKESPKKISNNRFDFI